MPIRLDKAGIRELWQLALQEEIGISFPVSGDIAWETIVSYVQSGRKEFKDSGIMVCGFPEKKEIWLMKKPLEELDDGIRTSG